MNVNNQTSRSEQQDLQLHRSLTDLVQTDVVQTDLVQTVIVQTDLVQTVMVQTDLVQTVVVQTDMVSVPDWCRLSQTGQKQSCGSCCSLTSVTN